MALKDGWPAQSGVADQIEIRKNLAGLIVRDTSGNPRAGIFPRHTNALVTSTATMNVAVAAFEAAAVRAGGPVFLSNDGSVNVLLDEAPVANSRYDVVYVRQKEDGYGGLADGSNGSEFGVQKGAASATPDKATVLAAIPDGAIPLASILIPSTATATNSGGVVITQEFPYTGLTGALLWFRNSTERDAAGAFAPLTRAALLDTGVEFKYASGWVPVAPPFCTLSLSANQTLTTAGTFYAASWDVELADGYGMHSSGNPTRITVPAAGVYEVSGQLYVSETTGSVTSVKVRVNGSTDARGSMTRLTPTSGAGAPLRIVVSVVLSAGDYIEVMVAAASNGSLLIGGSNNQSAVVTAKYLGPA